MKKTNTIFALIFLFASTLIPVSFADDMPAAPASGADYSDLEKTIKQDQMEDYKRRLKNLEQENRFLAQRVSMLERSLSDLRTQVEDNDFRYSH